MNAAERRKQLQAASDYVRSRIYTLENGYARTLLGQYKDAYAELSKKLDGIFAQYVNGDKWAATDANFRTRTEALLKQIGDEMERLNQRVHDALVDEQIRTYRASYYGNAWITSVTSNGAANVPLLPSEAVRAQVLFPYENGTQWFRLEQNRLEFINKMRGSMIQSQIQGETVYQAQKRLADALGLPIGRRTLDERQSNGGNFHRTEMIARTELLRSSNLGSQAVYDANADIVEGWRFEATLDSRTCPICGPLDGKEYKLSDTRNIPPKHPNCVLPGQLVSVPGSISAASKAFYVGRAVEIVTNSGRRIAVTENHPVLTAWGWVPAHLVGEFPEVVVTPDADGVVLGVGPNDHNMPTRIEQIFDALVMSRGVSARSVKVSAEDFHGDARRFYGDIDIVDTNGLLLGDAVMGFAQVFGQHGFDFGAVQGKTFARAGALGFDRVGVNLPAPSRLSLGGASGSLSVAQFGLHEVHGLRDVAGLYPEFDQPSANGGATYAKLTRQFLFGFPCDITTDKVVDVRYFDFSGHVYDLQCDPYALYSVNTIVVKNCRCSTTPVLKDAVEMGGGTRAAQGGPVSADMTYSEWAKANLVGDDADGGLRDLRPGKPPKSPGADPVRVKVRR